MARSFMIPFSPTAGSGLHRAHEVAVLVVYTLTIFVSASLLFLIQPMFAKMVLPLLGGAPAVWNTAMLFYQAVLLLGYGYAYLADKWLTPRWQVAVHFAVLALPLFALPIAVPLGWTPPTASNPLPWLLALLAVGVGLPFFAVSTNGPILQRWFGRTGHRSAADPYFLYAASNLGSMLALLSYPVLLEPLMRLRSQSMIWTAGYLLLAALIVACGCFVWRAPARTMSDPEMETDAPAAPQIGIGRRVRWVLLSLAPSSLMLGVTNYMSTDIASIPLLWIVPLALYLLTFILLFAPQPPVPHWLMVQALPILLLPLLVLIVAGVHRPVALLLPLHLVTFFVAAMVCHGELARDRPGPGHLTEFYLWMSFGGVLGGVFNALVAPLLFTSVVEYPLALVLACLLGPLPGVSPGWFRLSARTLDVLGPALLALVTLAAAAGIVRLAPGPLGTVLVFCVAAIVCFGFRHRSLRFGLGVGAILLVGLLYTGDQSRLLWSERSFFGIHRIFQTPTGNAHLLIHGTTLHGMQSLDPKHALEPLSYYSRSGPAGRVFAALNPAVSREIGVVGMGTGSLACYGKAGQRWTFYEIDPTVERIARDDRFFTFLRDSPPTIEVVLGDARLSLVNAAPQRFGLLILDAYSSDSIPLHLISREALHLYQSKLSDHGVLLFHISNRHLDLEPVIAALAQDAGLIARILDDTSRSNADATIEKTASRWVVMARRREDLGVLAESPHTREPRTNDAPVWTDDFSSLLSVFHWN